VQEYLSPPVKTEGAAMAHMTDEEAKRLDEKWTKNTPKPGPNGTGYFTQCKKNAHTLTALRQRTFTVC
jgi:hypothetical protein